MKIYFFLLNFENSAKSPIEVIDHARIPTFYHTFSTHMCTLQPQSRGTVTLKSANPHDHPLIDPKYLSEPQDLVDIVNGVKQTRELFNQPALAVYNGGEKFPGPK